MHWNGRDEIHEIAETNRNDFCEVADWREYGATRLRFQVPTSSTSTANPQSTGQNPLKRRDLAFGEARRFFLPDFLNTANTKNSSTAGMKFLLIAWASLFIEFIVM